MRVDAELVRHVADLANLRLTDAELKHYETQLSKIIGYVHQLSDLKLDSQEEYISDQPTPERNDVVATSLQVERVMAEAPRKIGTAFQVPRILD